MVLRQILVTKMRLPKSEGDMIVSIRKFEKTDIPNKVR